MRETPSTDNGRFQLPAELKLAVLDHLSQPAILSLACTSRTWRDAAVSHHNYFHYIPLYLHRVVGDQRAPNPAPSFAYACSALNRASRSGTRVSLQINLLVDPRGYGESPTERTLMAILPDLRSALHWSSVIALDITYSQYAEEILYKALDQPAPLLETLSLKFDYRRNPAMVPFPAHLFAGIAPRLRAVRLSGVFLGPVAIPAFFTVTSIDISSNFDHPLQLGVHFPSVTSVKLSSASPSYDLIDVDFTGLDIHTLRIAHMNRALGVIEHVPVVPVLELVGFQNTNLSGHWEALGVPISIVLEYFKSRGSAPNAYFRLTATNADESRRIAVEVNIGILAWRDLNNSAGHLSRIELDQRTLRSFFGWFAPGVVFSALEILVITVHVPGEPIWPVFDWPICLDCPLLKEICVRCALPGYAFPIVPPDQIAALRRAIPQSRERTERYILRLRGLTWTVPPAPSSEIYNTFEVVFE